MAFAAQGKNISGQTWTVGTDITSLSGILIKLTNTSTTTASNVYVKVYASVPVGFGGTGGTALVSASRSIPANTSATDFTFEFSSALTVTPLAQYFFSVSLYDDEAEHYYIGDGSSVKISTQSTGGYSGGSRYIVDYYYNASGDVVGTTYWTSQTLDTYFKTLYSASETEQTFTAQDPSTVVETILTNYNSSGGEVTYSASSIDNTGLSISYTFSVNTALEGIKKMLSLAPANWYWYVNPGTNILTFKAVATTADHTFIKGRHIEMLDLQATIERVKNIVYFTGGETAGVNLFLKATDADSLATNRTGVERITDGRVTVQATGEAIEQAFLNQNSDEQYITSITILAGTYDISTIYPGQTVQFRNFGVSFVEKLILQIVSVRRLADKVVLKLGMLPQRQTIQIENVQRSLLELQTANNPTTPS